MSKANDRLLAQLQSYLISNLQRTQQAAQTESPYLHQVGQDANQFLDQVNKKDYSQGFTPGTFWHMDSLADRSQHRDRLLNAQPQGDAALAGQQGKGFLELDKQNRKDEFAQNYGREFQDTVTQQTANAKNAQYQLGQLAQNRAMGAASDITGLLGTTFQAENQKPPSFGQQLVLGGLQALPGIIGGIRGHMGGGDNGGRSQGVGAGSGGFGTYTGYGNQVYGQQNAFPNYGLNTNPFSTVRTYSQPGR